MPLSLLMMFWTDAPVCWPPTSVAAWTRSGAGSIARAGWVTVPYPRTRSIRCPAVSPSGDAAAGGAAPGGRRAVPGQEHVPGAGGVVALEFRSDAGRVVDGEFRGEAVPPDP